MSVQGYVQRSPAMVYISVPLVAPESEVASAARMAQRLAHQQGKVPIYPPLFCYPYLTPEEMVKDLARVSKWWLRRVSRVWLMFPPSLGEDRRLDSGTFELLAALRRPHCAQRLPIQELHRHTEGLVPVALRDEEIENLLMENATAGLAHAGGVA